MSLLRFAEPHIYAPVDDSLVLWISGAGRGVGSRVFDLSGKGNHGTIHGACWKNTPLGHSALSFDGVDDYVKVADSQNLALDILTVILWVAGGYQIDDWANVVDKIDVNNVGWAIDVSGNGPKMRVRIDTSAVQNQIFYIGEALDEKWHQVAVVIENGEIRGYLDAQNTLQDVYEVGDGITCAKPLRIGNRSDNTNYFKGLIGEVHIYNRALSAREIRELYNRTKHLYGY